VRRAATVTVGAIVVLGGIVALLLVFQSRDSGDINGGASGAEGPGQLQEDRGARHGASAPAISAADLPASGEHAPAAVARDATDLSGDEWLHALELGNVILAYGSDEPGDALLRVQEDLAGAYDPELAAAGQSVILAHVEGLEEPTAVAWRRTLAFQDPSAPEVREFIEAWLGTGAPR
jgi:hypothetical protein